MDELFKSLSPLEKLGQRFIFGTNTENVEIIETLIRDYHIGGVILYKRNYKTYDDMLEVIKRFKNANKDNKVPLFIAIDQEGGKVNRMPDEVHRLKNIYDVTKKNDLLVNDYARLIAKMLSESGINMNLAPVVDIYNNSESGVVYKRCFYGNSDDIVRLGDRYIKELENQNVLSVIKHFPGHGITKFDSHRLVPYVFDYKKVLDVHMKPFNELLQSVDAIMMGHIAIRKLTSFMPASISDSFIKKYIRENNKFDGLIITDEINMLRRHPFYRFMFLSKALKGNNDLLLVKVNSVKQGSKFIEKYKKMCNLNRLDESVKRILRMKDKYKITDSVDNLGMNIEEINELIDEINKDFESV